MIQNVVLLFLLSDRGTYYIIVLNLYIYSYCKASAAKGYTEKSSRDQIGYHLFKLGFERILLRFVEPSKKEVFYAIHNTMHFHSSILQQQAVFRSFVKSCLKVYYLLESAFVCFCFLLQLYIATKSCHAKVSQYENLFFVN